MGFVSTKVVVTLISGVHLFLPKGEEKKKKINCKLFELQSKQLALDLKCFLLLSTFILFCGLNFFVNFFLVQYSQDSIILTEAHAS